MDKSFIMMVGLPGSGKSTKATEEYASKNFTIISADDDISAFAIANDISYQDAYDRHIDAATARCHAAARDAFAKGENVLWDQTNMSLDERSRKMAAVPADYFKMAITFELPVAELTDRFVGRFRETGKSVSPSTLNDLQKSYERPGRYEGFDHVEIITQ